MVILHVFLVWSQEASGKHILAIQRVTSRSLCAMQPGEVVQISCNSRADFLGSAHLGLKMCPGVGAAASTGRLMFSLPYLVSLALLLLLGLLHVVLTLGINTRVRKELHLTSIIKDQPHFTLSRQGKGFLRGMFQAMPSSSRLGPTKDCWVSLTFRLDFWSLVGRVDGVPALPDTCCYGVGV